MWLTPDSLRRWMRPGGAEVVSVDLQPTVGGAFRIDTQDPDGQIFIHMGRYVEIQRPARLVFTWSSSVLGEQLSQVTIEFHRQGEGCLMVLRHDLPPDETLFADHQKGWTAVLDLLARQCVEDRR